MKRISAQDLVYPGGGTRGINGAYLARHIGEPTESGCRPWTGMTNNIGYPFIGYSDRTVNKRGMMLATRALLMIDLARPIKPGYNANHSCHNRWCMNIDHIQEGTQQQKIAHMKQDRIQAQRTNPGAYHHRQQNRQYSHTDEEIQFMRVSTTDQVQARFAVTRDQAYRLRRNARTNFKWLPWPEE